MKLNRSINKNKTADNIKVFKPKSIGDFSGLLKNKKHKLTKEDTYGVWLERYIRYQKQN